MTWLFAIDENSWGYVTAVYLIAIVVLVAYVTTIIIRGRRAGRRLPPEDRRWL